MPFVTEDGNRAESSPARGKSVRPARSSRPLEFLLGVLIAAGLWTIFFVTWIEPLQSHSRWSSRVDKDLRSLAHMRPTGVSKGEWEWIVGSQPPRQLRQRRSACRAGVAQRVRGRAGKAAAGADHYRGHRLDLG
jgi:hypothetical protein